MEKYRLLKYWKGLYDFLKKYIFIFLCISYGFVPNKYENIKIINFLTINFSSKVYSFHKNFSML